MREREKYGEWERKRTITERKMGEGWHGTINLCELQKLVNPEFTFSESE